MSKKAPRRPSILAVIAIAAVVAIGGVLALRWVEMSADRAGGVSSGRALIGGPFALNDQTGKPVTDQDFRGRLMLVYFGYTFCPDVCPTDLQKISAVMEMLGPDADKVAPVFITVDPERDTTDQMARYLSLFNDHITGLTGTPEAIAAAAKEYRVYYQAVRDDASATDYLVDHSAFIYLMDREGAYLTHFNRGDTPDTIVAAIKQRL
ncbi:SCO family protein [Tistrella mobilis]|uniref:Classical-complement-pathway C3/C5 convertase n=2 Tax=Tistrella mobilis TaxID=171437 RepID=I3TQE8_TISMK|nr:SCO family protein [Tistrella mobilis]AFK54986.1 Classical-complement-pathway C3/C5 convertase [Tistrella mobilis KA081020-065]